MVLPLLLACLSPAWAQSPAPADPATTAQTAEDEGFLPLLVEPELLEFVQAPYPPEAEAQGLEGSVILVLTIDELGAVVEVEVAGPAGHGFDEAAVAAAAGFRFRPAEDANGPTPVAIEFEYGFVLDAEAVPEAIPEDRPVEDAPHPVNLEGVLLEMGTRSPLAGVLVQLTAADGSQHQASTDGAGAYQFRGVPVGTAKLEARFPGFNQTRRTVEVVEGQVTAVRLWLRNQAYRDNEIIGVYRKRSDDVTRRTISMQEVRRIPGTFGDPVRVIQNLPGAARSPFGTGFLVIRGANPEDSGVYVDGIRIPLIYHLGGYVSVLNADLVESVDYLPGGYGVHYGRSMGGVVDVKTKTEAPDRPRLTWSTDLLDSGGLFETKVGANKQTGLAIAARRSYVDALIPLFTPDPDFVVKPSWYDYQIKLQDLDSAGGRASLFVFGFEDKLLASTPPDFAQGTDPATQGDLGTSYGTHRLIFRWEQDLGQDLSLMLSPSVGVDTVSLNVGNDIRLDQTLLLPELRSELAWSPTPHFTLSEGVDFIGLRYWFTTRLPISPDSFDNYDPIGEREPWEITSTGWVWGPDPYVDAKIRPLADPERLLLNPGVRVNWVGIEDDENPDPVWNRASVDPRFAFRWGAREGGTLKGGLGLYHQPPQPFEAWRPEGTVELVYERALATELGWEQILADGLSLDVVGFYKRLDHLIVENSEYTDLSSQYFTNEGIGRIYGGEFILRQAPVGRFFGWVSYTLSKSERNDYPDRAPDDRALITPGDPDAGSWYPFEFDQTHILVAIAGYRLPKDWEVSVKAQTVTGNPQTPYDGGVYDVDQDFYYPYASGGYDSDRLPAYVAVDARIDKLWSFKHWRLETYLDLLSVVRGVNPEFVLYNYDYTDSVYISGLPFIPSPGFEAEVLF